MAHSRCVRLILLLLVGAIVTLAPLAHASPPDSTWLAGLYDDADHDDVVLAIIDATGIPPVDRPVTTPVGLSDTIGAFVGPTRPDAPSRISLVDRAPPRR